MTELELIFTLKCILNTLLMKNNLKKSITYNIRFDCCIAYLLVLLCPWRIFYWSFKPCYWIFFNSCAASLGNTFVTFAITPRISDKTISKGRFGIAVKILCTTCTAHQFFAIFVRAVLQPPASFNFVVHPIFVIKSVVYRNQHKVLLNAENWYHRHNVMVLLQ